MTDSYASSRTGDVSPSNGYAQSSSPSTGPSAPASNVIRKKLMGYVGFANLPNQVHRKSVRKGFQFTAMVVGTWLPRSTDLALQLITAFSFSFLRRVRVGKVHAHQHSFQHDSLPSQGASSSHRREAQDCRYREHRSGYVAMPFMVI